MLISPASRENRREKNREKKKLRRQQKLERINSQRREKILRKKSNQEKKAERKAVKRLKKKESMEYKLAKPVTTSMGPGLLLKTRNDGTWIVELDWKLANDSKAVMYIPKSKTKPVKTTKFKKKTVQPKQKGGKVKNMLVLNDF